MQPNAAPLELLACMVHKTKQALRLDLTWFLNEPVFLLIPTLSLTLNLPANVQPNRRSLLASLS
jgi:hypothetical protein